jgi:hypothetical protein
VGYWGSSDGGGVQGIARNNSIQRQHIRRQSTGPLYNKITDKLGKGLDLLTIEKISFCRPGRKDC